MAMQYMASVERSGVLVSARQISTTYHIPYALMAKIMQGLSQHGLVKSVHGTKGGYLLAKRAKDITVADVLVVFDGPVAVVECFQHKKIDCEQWKECSVKNPFYELNRRIQDILIKTTIADLSKKSDSSLAVPTLSTGHLAAGRMAV